MTDLLHVLEDEQVGPILTNAPLAEHTSYRVGGPAEILVQPTNIAAVAKVVSAANDAGVPRVVIGWGSNLIASDDGFDGVVIKLAEAFRYVRIPDAVRYDGDSVSVTVGAATMNAHLVRDLHRSALSGAEFLALIPGTFGGAVVMNAGTKQGELKDIVEWVTIVTGGGEIAMLEADVLNFRYRGSDLPAGAIVVEGGITATCGGVAQGQEQVRREREARNRTQPYQLPSAGSVFKNPPGDYAGRLIEAAGLKGQRSGGAQISTLHANFIVTEEGAKAIDVLRLMAVARRQVADKFGVTLDAEQHLLGFGVQSSNSLLDRLAEEEL